MLVDTDALAMHRNAYQLFHGNSSVNYSHYYTKIIGLYSVCCDCVACAMQER